MIKQGIPKSQKIWTSYINKGEITHIITSSVARDKYFLYEANSDGSFIKIATSTQPIFKNFND